MNIPSALLLDPHNPGRPPDARWLRVLDLADRGEPAKGKFDDDWVKRGLGYLTRLRACCDDADRQQLALDVPSLDGAYRLHAGDKLARAIVEARLLTGADTGAVADACGLAPEAVRAYEALFFAVAGKLQARGWVLRHGVGPRLWDGLTEDDADVVLKHLAYSRGPAALEEGIRYFRGEWSVPDCLDGLGDAQLRELVAMLHVRARVLALSLTPEKGGRLARLTGLIQELEGLLASGPGGPVAVAVTAAVEGGVAEAGVRSAGEARSGRRPAAGAA